MVLPNFIPRRLGRRADSRKAIETVNNRSIEVLHKPPAEAGRISQVRLQHQLMSQIRPKSRYRDGSFPGGGIFNWRRGKSSGSSAILVQSVGIDLILPTQKTQES